MFIYLCGTHSEPGLPVKETENKILLGKKNTKVIVINHKGTRMVKGGED